MFYVAEVDLEFLIFHLSSQVLGLEVPPTLGHFYLQMLVECLCHKQQALFQANL